jgi:hypothetical protein
LRELEGAYEGVALAGAGSGAWRYAGATV